MTSASETDVEDDIRNHGMSDDDVGYGWEGAVLSSDSADSDGSLSPARDNWFDETFCDDPFLWGGDDTSSADGSEASWSGSFGTNLDVDSSGSSDEASTRCGDLSDEPDDFDFDLDQRNDYAGSHRTPSSGGDQRPSPRIKLELAMPTATAVPTAAVPTAMATMDTDSKSAPVETLACWVTGSSVVANVVPPLCPNPEAARAAAHAARTKRNAAAAAASANPAAHCGDSNSFRPRWPEQQQDGKWTDGVALKPTMRSRKKTMVVRFKQFSHAYSEAEEIYVYKYLINPTRTYAVSAPVSQLAEPIFCFLGCNWPSTQYSAVPNSVDDGYYVWRLNSMTLSSLGDDEADSSATVQVYFGICGWRSGAAGMAMVLEEHPDAPAPPRASSTACALQGPPAAGLPVALVSAPELHPAHGSAKGGALALPQFLCTAAKGAAKTTNCAFCPAVLTKNFTKRYRKECGYTGPDFCGKCAKTVQRHERGEAAKDQHVKGHGHLLVCTAENRCSICTGILAHVPAEKPKSGQRKRKSGSLASGVSLPQSKRGALSAAVATGFAVILMVAFLTFSADLQSDVSSSQTAPQSVKNIWQWVRTNSYVIPFASEAYSISSVGPAVLLFGGRSELGQGTNDMWMLNGSRVLELKPGIIGIAGVPAIGNPATIRLMMPLTSTRNLVGSLSGDMLWPCAREHAMTWNNGQSLFLYGGRAALGDMQDLWRYDMEAKLWDFVWTGGQSIGFPAAAAGGSAQQVNALELVNWLSSSDPVPVSVAWPVARHSASIVRGGGPASSEATYMFGGLLLLSEEAAANPLLRSNNRSTGPMRGASTGRCHLTGCGLPFVLLNDLWRIDEGLLPAGAASSVGHMMPTSPWTFVGPPEPAGLPLFNYVEQNSQHYPAARAAAGLFVESRGESGLAAAFERGFETVWLFGGLGLDANNHPDPSEPVELRDLWSTLINTNPRVGATGHAEYVRPPGGQRGDAQRCGTGFWYPGCARPTTEWVWHGPVLGGSGGGGGGGGSLSPREAWPAPRRQPSMLWLPQSDGTTTAAAAPPRRPLLFGGRSGGTGTQLVHRDFEVGPEPTVYFKDLWALQLAGTPTHHLGGERHPVTWEASWARVPVQPLLAAGGAAWTGSGGLRSTNAVGYDDDGDDDGVVGVVDGGRCILRQWLDGQPLSAPLQVQRFPTVCRDEDSWRSMWGDRCDSYRAGGENEDRCESDSAEKFCMASCGRCEPSDDATQAARWAEVLARAEAAERTEAQADHSDGFESDSVVGSIDSNDETMRNRWADLLARIDAKKATDPQWLVDNGYAGTTAEVAGAGVSPRMSPPTPPAVLLSTPPAVLLSTTHGDDTNTSGSVGLEARTLTVTIRAAEPAVEPVAEDAVRGQLLSTTSAAAVQQPSAVGGNQLASEAADMELRANSFASLLEAADPAGDGGLRMRLSIECLEEEQLSW